MGHMPHLRIRDAARFLAVSDDTVRRWISAGTLTAERDDAGRTVVDSLQLAELARRDAHLVDDGGDGRSSARNRFSGIVTAVQIDGLVAQVEIQSGPHRVVSLMTSEAVRALALEPGSLAVASVKATMVTVETADRA
jgi:molybdopterin-binding protein